MRRAAISAVTVALCAAPSLAQDLAERARASARDVFQRAEFQPLADADKIPDLPHVDVDAPWLGDVLTWMRDLLVDVLEGVGGFLGEIFDWLFRGVRGLFGGGGSGVSGAAFSGSTVAAWGLAIVAVALLAYLVIRLARSAGEERRAAALAISLGPMEDEHEDALARSPEGWRRRAERLAAGGRRTEALRALYLELLAGLHRAGAIDYDRTRTNTAYIQDVPRTHSAHAPFDALTARFDRAVYGQREPTAESLRAAIDEVESVKRAFQPEPAVAR